MDFDFTQTGTQSAYAEFAEHLQDLSGQIGFKVSSRGWCYILEQAGVINKDQFDKVNTWVNKCRKYGHLPIDFVAEEDARAFKGIRSGSPGDNWAAEPDTDSPVQDIKTWINEALRCENRYEVDWWQGENYYVQMVVEKIDLVTLFTPVCRQFHVPIANAKGWSSMLQRAEYARRFAEAEERGMEGVLLYCGDHDPAGLLISDTLRKNLRDLRKIVWEDGTEGYNPANLHIDRFGLNFEFIEEHGFTWIDNLVTGGGGDLSNPNHHFHNYPYVQQYLADIGPRKCEANVLVTQPAVATQLCRSALENWLGEDAEARFQAKRQAVLDYVETFREESGVGDQLQEVLDKIDDEDTYMEGHDWHWNE